MRAIVVRSYRRRNRISLFFAPVYENLGVRASVSSFQPNVLDFVLQLKAAEERVNGARSTSFLYAKIVLLLQDIKQLVYHRNSRLLQVVVLSVGKRSECFCQQKVRLFLPEL